MNGRVGKRERRLGGYGEEGKVGEQETHRAVGTNININHSDINPLYILVKVSLNPR